MEKEENQLNLISNLMSLQDLMEQQMLNLLGFKIYKTFEGFTQEKLYNLAGRYDYVCTLSLKTGSPSEKIYGNELTVVFSYTLKERKSLEIDASSLNTCPRIKAKYLVGDLKEEQIQQLQEQGIITQDIVELLVAPFNDKNNTYPSKELRTPKTLKIPFQLEGGGEDIYWMYGSLRKLKERGVGLSPNDESQYLAYKLIVEPNELSSEEQSLIFNDKHEISNNEVAWNYLIWKKEAGKLNATDERNLLILSQIRIAERIEYVDAELTKMGLSWQKLNQRYPSHAKIIGEKILRFNDISFNSSGKYPLYINFNSLIHIYLRHVKEMEVKEQFSDKDKFQLKEQDVLVVMKIVLKELNEEYQNYKKTNPKGRFYRKGMRAYYFNGDYYNVHVSENGCVETFYKGSGNKTPQ